MEEDPGEPPRNNADLGTPSNTFERRKLIPRAHRKRQEAWRKRKNKREEREVERRRDMTDTDSEEEDPQSAGATLAHRLHL
jgi:hypothetical protein